MTLREAIDNDLFISCIDLIDALGKFANIICEDMKSINANSDSDIDAFKTMLYELNRLHEHLPENQRLLQATISYLVQSPDMATIQERVKIICDVYNEFVKRFN